MRIGLTTAAFYGLLETEDAASAVASLRLPCCEVFLETYSEYTGAFGALVKERLLGTEAVSVHCKTQHFEADLVGQSARQRADAYAMLEGFLDAAAALGAKTYVYHGPANMRGRTPCFASWQEGIAEAMRRCALRGVTFAWETVSWCWLNGPGRVKEFLALWPNLSFVLDIKQAIEMGHDPIAFVDAMGDRLCHMHILDFDENGRHALPGRGVHDCKDLAAALRANGYQGDIILEPYAHMAASDASLMGAVQWLRDTFRAG
ncbi:MAG: sugar phosphate isomerase/epimerase [Firmicutes bacterium]|nr:sugar phosphate isomerase/epimerase [Bacillota bacterium]